MRPEERKAFASADPARIRAVAASYPISTSETVGGFQPRHVSALGDEALDTLSTILAVVELLGLWPEQLAIIIVQLLDKPKGGYRPICLFAASVHVWERMRRQECAAWCLRWQRPYWCFTAGAGAALSVWRQQLRVEAEVEGKGSVAGGVLRGMHKVYESVDLHLLSDRFNCTGFPPIIARLLINTWRGPRAIKLRQTIDAAKHFARSGLPAGSAFADLAVIAYTVIQYGALCARWPRATLAVYVDAQHIGAEGDEDHAIRTVVGATKELEYMVKEYCKASFADDKRTHVATDQELANKLCAAFWGGRGGAQRLRTLAATTKREPQGLGAVAASRGEPG